MPTINKRFPADTTLKEQTFLNNKKINGELYALLLSYSYPDDQKRTVVMKKSLPTQATLCSQLGIKSPKTYRVHLQYLITLGYVIDESDRYFMPQKEDIFFNIPLETVKYLNDTMKEQVIKIYIYLGQRNKYKPNQYVFTIEEIAEHIGLKLDNHSRNYDIVNNALVCLKNNELIDYVEFYEGKYPKKRLINFTFKVKNLKG